MMKDFEKRYIEARKELIRAEFAHLNPMQQEAVLATEGPLLILAGAGSGKTTVLINRIANLLKFGRAGDSDELPYDADEKQLETLLAGGDRAKYLAAFEPVEPWRILAITFTNKAAGELKDRLENMLGESARDIWACTFHSACVRILRRDAERLGYTSSYTIYDTSDSQSLIKHILKDIDIDDKMFAPRMLMAEISRAKDQGISASQYQEMPGDIRHKTIGRVYAEYSKRAFTANAMDFDDLIFNTVKLLEDNPEVLDYWQRRFKYVLIDEYQDTNLLQYRLSSLLAGGWGNICVVGDDDQSIYKFRGATIENILSFESQYKNCRLIRLEQNYRSTAHILDSANAVISNNTRRKGKELWTDKDGGDLLELYVADDQIDEAQYVASVLMGEYGRGANWRDHAVLYRMNVLSKNFEDAFKRLGIPYKVVGGTGFYERAEVKDVLAYLCIIASPNDDLRLSRIINSPARGIGLRTIGVVSELAQANACSMFDIVNEADRYPELSRSSIKLRQFANMIKELRSFAETRGADEVLDELLEKTGYVRMLEEKNTTEDTARAENVREIKTGIFTYMKESGDNSLEGYLANVALYTDLDSYDQDEDKVVLMTMHSAKGLEFPTVFIIGMEDGVFPSMRSIGEFEEMEEERRLAYVAMTRAQKKLYLTCAKYRMLFGQTRPYRVSRFASEVPDKHIKKNIPKGYAYTDKSYEQTIAEWEYRQPKLSFSAPAPTAKPKTPVAAPAAPALPAFALGDNVNHNAFGSGVITKLTAMGGDYLVEINFAKIGTKKLMLRAAAQYMTKE